MKLAELEKKLQRPRGKSFTPITTCKECGREIRQGSDTKLCAACREFNAMLDKGKDKICVNGHKTMSGERCKECRRNSKARAAEALRRKRAEQRTSA